MRERTPGGIGALCSLLARIAGKIYLGHDTESQALPPRTTGCPQPPVTLYGRMFRGDGAFGVSGIGCY